MIKKTTKIIKNFKKINIGINDYKIFFKIELEIIPIDKNQDKNYFININKKDKPYFHIYFNNDNNEIKKSYFTIDDNIQKIKIIIYREFKSFEKLFINCTCIEKN